MKPEIKKLWLEALRSGEYKQTTGQLRRGDAHCCLGVLTDLYLKAHGEVWGDRDVRSGNLGLSDTVQKWAGVRSSSPKARGQHLSDLNDDYVPFPEIADLIEKHL